MRRVPKTGSTSLMNVAYELQAENRQDKAKILKNQLLSKLIWAGSVLWEFM